MAEFNQGRIAAAPHCPACGQKLDGWTALEKDTQPRPDDCSICAYCNVVLVFTEELSLRVASVEETVRFVEVINRIRREKS